MDYICEKWRDCPASGGCSHSVRHKLYHNVTGQMLCYGDTRHFCTFADDFVSCREAGSGEYPKKIRVMKPKPDKDKIIPLEGILE